MINKRKNIIIIILISFIYIGVNITPAYAFTLNNDNLIYYFNGEVSSYNSINLINKNNNNNYLLANTNNLSQISTKHYENTTQKILVLLIQFSDSYIRRSDIEWSNMFFGNNGNTVNAYYNEVSNKKFYFTPAQEKSNLINDGVIKVTLKYKHPNIGKNCSSEINQQVIKDALSYADKYIDYSKFDTNYDGYISADELHIVSVFSGYEYDGRNSPSVLSNRYVLKTPITLDGVRLCDDRHDGGYVEAGENYVTRGIECINPVGIWCHELGHDLGLKDLYNTATNDKGVGIHSLMATGCDAYNQNQNQGTCPTHLDPWSKIYLGFTAPEVVTSSGIFVLNSISTGSYDVLKVNTPNPNEYFLLENRQFEGFDRSLSSVCKSGGIAIWHIDENVIKDKFDYGINNDNIHKGIAIEEANEGIVGHSQLDADDDESKDAYDHYYYLNGNNKFDSTTMPSSKLYDGQDSYISIEVLDKPDDTMRVKIGIEPNLPVIGAITSPKSNEKISGVYNINGWILDNNKVSKIDVIVDGKIKGQATYGSVRENYDKLYPGYNNKNCGFSYKLQTSSLTPGKHTILVRETNTKNVMTNIRSVIFINKDVQKPIIKVLSIKKTSKNNGLEVVASVSDYSTIKSVNLYFNTQISKKYISMNMRGNKKYTVQIPKNYLKGKIIYYYIQAKDGESNMGNLGTSTKPTILKIK